MGYAVACVWSGCVADLSPHSRITCSVSIANCRLEVHSIFAARTNQCNALLITTMSVHLQARVLYVYSHMDVTHHVEVIGFRTENPVRPTSICKVFCHSFASTGVCRHWPVTFCMRVASMRFIICISLSEQGLGVKAAPTNSTIGSGVCP
jgi:hypothetical protein